MTRIERQIHKELRREGVTIGDIAALYDRAVRGSFRTYHGTNWTAVAEAIEDKFGPGSMNEVRKERPLA